MRLLFGIVAVFLSVLGGFAAMGGRMGVLWQPVEIVIIVGAGIGGYVIANSMAVLRATVRTIGAVARRGVVVPAVAAFLDFLRTGGPVVAAGALGPYARPASPGETGVSSGR